MKTVKVYFLIVIFCTTVFSADKLEHIHLLIPGGIGGGWDDTARSVGLALKESNLVHSISFENISGNSGGKAISYLIRTANTQKNTLMVNSTPIVIRSLQKVSSDSFKDLTLIASIITDYQVLAVRIDSELNSLNDIVKAFKKNPHKLKVGGGSSRGGMDHLVCAQIFKSLDLNPNDLYYISYDGVEALDALFNKDIDIISTGFGEVFDKHKKGSLKIIAVTSKNPIVGAEDIPTFNSLGINMDFINWRGFFAAPGIDKLRVKKIQMILKKMLDTPKWKEIQKRNGWKNLYKTDKEFETLLREQEDSISMIIRDLGIL